MKKREIIKKFNFEKGFKIAKAILFIAMLVLIYLASPRIAQLVKEIALYIYNMDKDIIIRIVELVLTVIFLSFVMFFEKKNNK